MSSFFNKSDSQDNLQYDDTAFMHFMISACSITALIFVYLIYRDVTARTKSNIKAVRKMEHFKAKLANTEKSEVSYIKTSGFGIKLLVIVCCLLSGIWAYSNVEENSTMIGFDPYEILGINMDASTTVIKKAYRKLALTYHPDRNSNNPEAAAKFIRISKAYECLTDPQAKQKCQKYGNPDGQISYKVGIGLPRFMIDVQNQYLVLPPIFIIFLVIIPMFAMKWMKKQKPKDDNGNFISNYPIMYSLMSPRVNPITFSAMMSCMKELNPVFPKDQLLEEGFEKGLKQILVKSQALFPQQLEILTRPQLFRVGAVYGYMANRTKNEEMAQIIPEVTEKILKFTFFFAQRMLDQKPLLGNPNWILHWCGMEPTKFAIFFARQIFNPSIRVGNPHSIEFLDLTPEECQICVDNPIKHLQANLLDSEEKISNYVKKFPEGRQQYIKDQILCLPAFQMTTRVVLGDDVVTEMTFDDFATFQVSIKKKRFTPGYVVSRDYPFLAKQKFIVMISFNSNLLFQSDVQIPEGKDEVTVKFQYRQAVQKQMKFIVNMISLNYPNMDLDGEINVDVLAPTAQKAIQIHKEDLQMDKAPKNFFESLASMETATANDSDRELSDSEDDEKPEVPVKKKAAFEEEEQDMGKKKN